LLDSENAGWRTGTTSSSRCWDWTRCARFLAHGVLADHFGPELEALPLETGNEKWKVVAGDEADEGGGCESGSTYRGTFDNRHRSARSNVQM